MFLLGIHIIYNNYEVCMKFHFVFQFMTNSTTHSHFQYYSTLENNAKLHLSWRSSRGSTRPTSFALLVEYTSPFGSKEKKNSPQPTTTYNKQRAQPIRNRGMQVEKKIRKLYKHHRQSR